MGNKKATDKFLTHARLPAPVSPAHLTYMQIVVHSR